MKYTWRLALSCLSFLVLEAPLYALYRPAPPFYSNWRPGQTIRDLRVPTRFLGDFMKYPGWLPPLIPLDYYEANADTFLNHSSLGRRIVRDIDFSKDKLALTLDVIETVLSNAQVQRLHNDEASLRAPLKKILGHKDLALRLRAASLLQKFHPIESGEDIYTREAWEYVIKRLLPSTPVRELEKLIAAGFDLNTVFEDQARQRIYTSLEKAAEVKNKAIMRFILLNGGTILPLPPALGLGDLAWNAAERAKFWNVGELARQNALDVLSEIKEQRRRIFRESFHQGEIRKKTLLSKLSSRKKAASAAIPYIPIQLTDIVLDYMVNPPAAAATEALIQTPQEIDAQ